MDSMTLKALQVTNGSKVILVAAQGLHQGLYILVLVLLAEDLTTKLGISNVLYRFSSIWIVLLSDDILIHLLPKTHYHEIHIQASLSFRFQLVFLFLRLGLTYTSSLLVHLTIHVLMGMLHYLKVIK
ncbi:thiamine pyrophosphokinase 1-like isoform X1 [Iris pallida]|uniref:Thiamine pyrophosphokinase 1-like isoform X1 n=1 Tax=Iris pallida TaxID=29817 RepID=A0AAX6GB16_IRIPA|nr:thiamine pyrophosphokinase 1-like isoform X1 [Iris pallida]